MALILKQLTPKLPHLCQSYKLQLNYAYKNRVHMNMHLGMNFTNTNLGFIYQKGKAMNQRDEWIRSLARLNPYKFMNGQINYHWLYDQHKKQLGFHKRIQPLIDPLDLSSNSRDMGQLLLQYATFLEICSENKDEIIVPTLLEDFVWHSHMIDHETYVNDMKKILGKILGHTNDDDHTQYQNRSNEIRQNHYNKVLLANQSSSCSAMIISPSNPINPHPKSSNTSSDDSSSCNTSSDVTSSCNSSGCSSGCGGSGCSS